MNESSLAVVSVFLGLSLVSLQFLHWSVAGLSFRDQFLNLFLRAPELKGKEPKGRKPGGSSRLCMCDEEPPGNFPTGDQPEDTGNDKKKKKNDKRLNVFFT